MRDWYVFFLIPPHSMDNIPLPSREIKMNLHNFQTVIVTPSIIIPEQRSSEQDSATINGAPPPDRPKSFMAQTRWSARDSCNCAIRPEGGGRGKLSEVGEGGAPRAPVPL